MFGKKKDERNSQIQSEPLKLTTIAMGTVIKGTVDVEGSLRVDGTIEGNVSCHKTMILGPQGTIIGNVTSVSAILHGILKGDIYTCKLEIEPKALFNGACKTMEENIQPQGQSLE